VKFDVVILGLSVTSSWGNGHATTYRGLIKGLHERGHSVLFLERDQPWYAGNRDEPNPPGAVTALYTTVEELKTNHERAVRDAGLVIVGSFVPDGIEIGDWATTIATGRTAFYDIDTPLTLSKLEAGECTYLTPDSIPRYHCYLSFTGGPTLRRIEQQYESPMARVLYCSVDPEHYRPVRSPYLWDLGYLGTYSPDRQPALEQLLLEPARRWSEGSFAVVGPGYPEISDWPLNVDRHIHLSPRDHPEFYGSQRFGLNLTRAPMKAAGYSPSVRLFEAAACSTPVISDWWEGLDSFLSIGKEVLIAENAETVLRYLRDTPEPVRIAIGDAARRRILTQHTPHHRALQIESYLKEMYDHASAHPPRRDRRGRQGAGRMDAGLASEHCGTYASAASGTTAVQTSSAECVHQPTGTDS
jgi:spore maturation protein CgeB